MSSHAKGTPPWANAMVATDVEASAPVVGELWTLSWNMRFEGVVLIAAVFDDYVLGMPVTNDAASQAEVVIAEGLAVWPQAETGLGTFLLHRPLDTALTAEQVGELRRWNAGLGELTSLRAGDGSHDEATFDGLLAAMQDRCFIQWPSDAEAILDRAAVGMTNRQFIEATGLPVPRALELWGGAPLEPSDVDALGDRAEEWTVVTHDAVTNELSSPALKDLVTMLATVASLDERAARNRARRSHYTLAARSTSAVARSATQVRDTLLTLIDEARAT